MVISVLGCGNRNFDSSRRNFFSNPACCSCSLIYFDIWCLMLLRDAYYATRTWKFVYHLRGPCQKESLQPSPRHLSMMNLPISSSLIESVHVLPQQNRFLLQIIWWSLNWLGWHLHIFWYCYCLEIGFCCSSLCITWGSPCNAKKIIYVAHLALHCFLTNCGLAAILLTAIYLCHSYFSVYVHFLAVVDMDFC